MWWCCLSRRHAQRWQAASVTVSRSTVSVPISATNPVVQTKRRRNLILSTDLAVGLAHRASSFGQSPSLGGALVVPTPGPGDRRGNHQEDHGDPKRSMKAGRSRGCTAGEGSQSS